MAPRRYLLLDSDVLYALYEDSPELIGIQKRIRASIGETAAYLVAFPSRTGLEFLLDGIHRNGSIESRERVEELRLIVDEELAGMTIYGGAEVAEDYVKRQTQAIRSQAQCHPYISWIQAILARVRAARPDDDVRLLTLSQAIASMLPPEDVEWLPSDA